MSFIIGLCNYSELSKRQTNNLFRISLASDHSGDSEDKRLAITRRISSELFPVSRNKMPFNEWEKRPSPQATFVIRPWQQIRIPTTLPKIVMAFPLFFTFH